MPTPTISEDKYVRRLRVNSVPSRYIDMLKFVARYNKVNKYGPTWDEIAIVMRWSNLPREEQRSLILGGVRWGLIPGIEQRETRVRSAVAKELLRDEL